MAKVVKVSHLLKGELVENWVLANGPNHEGSWVVFSHHFGLNRIEDEASGGDRGSGRSGGAEAHDLCPIVSPQI
jgi:hypothetical protein